MFIKCGLWHIAENYFNLLRDWIMKKWAVHNSLLVVGFALLTSTACRKTVYNNPPIDNAPVGYQNIFNDDFNVDQYGWNFTDNFNAAFGQVANGEYYFSYQAPGDNTYSTTIPTGMRYQQNFLIQTRLESNRAMALNFGVGNQEYGYSFFIDNTGYFAIYDEGTPNVLASSIIDWTYEASILPGYNDIEIEQVGGTWFGYINQRQVFAIPARTLYGSSVGFLNLAGTDGYADYLTIKW